MKQYGTIWNNMEQWNKVTLWNNETKERDLMLCSAVAVTFPVMPIV
jgi:hypothetical protein